MGCIRERSTQVLIPSCHLNPVLVILRVPCPALLCSAQCCCGDAIRWLHNWGNATNRTKLGCSHYPSQGSSERACFKPQPCHPSFPCCPSPSPWSLHLWPHPSPPANIMMRTKVLPCSLPPFTRQNMKLLTDLSVIHILSYSRTCRRRL